MADWLTAERKLQRDKIFRPLVKRIGPCTLVPLEREPYEALVRAIAHQQVHGRAAEAVLNRFCALYEGEGFPSADFVLALPPEALRGCGFSGSKVLAIQDIAAKTRDGVVPSLEDAARIEDGALIERLVAAGVLLQTGRADPGVIAQAVDTASAQGWRRPLLAWLGVRPDFMEATATAPFWIKFAYTLGTAAAMLWLVERLARPGARTALQTIVAGVPLGLMALLGMAQWITAAPASASSYRAAA